MEKLMRKTHLRLYSYLTRNMVTILGPVENSSAVFALFDQDGLLLEYYGNEKAKSDLRADGIKERDLWNMENTGPNAVTLGLAEGRAQVSIGEENKLRPLKNYALYFSPIMLKIATPPHTVINYGGLALIVPAARQNPDYLITVSALTHDLIMTLHFNQTANMLYERSGRGVFSIDTRLQDGKETIVYCSEIIFDFFGIPPFDVDFCPADTLIDPLPKNPEFWALLKEPKRMTDYAIPLSGQGKKISCIISTDIFDQPLINARGLIFYITTSQHISASVSKRMGNNAVFVFDNIIGQSPVIKSAIQRGKLLAQTDSNIMLLGESGVGKDIFAQAIHNTSGRREKPFIAVNCGAFPRDLIASELFGYAGGAFTGANRQGNIGKFELANGGTIFLDEIGELPLDLQVNLLRIVEQKQLMRIGGNDLINIDVKIISATNADIPLMIEQKRFRADLYYRLSTVRLNIPPLRSRGEDIILLAEYFIRTISERTGCAEIKTLSPASKKLLMELPFQGNVRELQNLIESIVQLYGEPVIETDHIMENLSVIHVENTENAQYKPAGFLPAKKHELLNREKIREALEKCGGNRSEAARYLGIARKTLYRNMERLGME
jgi:transcriptional regulator with PAS, ATPase and Fis domain